MVHLYLCLPDRCEQKIHKRKGDRQCKIGQRENVCLFCSYVFSVRTGQADRGKQGKNRGKNYSWILDYSRFNYFSVTHTFKVVISSKL